MRNVKHFAFGASIYAFLVCFANADTSMDSAESLATNIQLLSGNQLGFTAIVEAQKLTSTLLNDLVDSHKDKAALMASVKSTALKYKKTQFAATAAAKRVEEAADVFVKWMPTLRKMVEQDSVNGVQAIMEKLVQDIEALAVEFQVYADEHKEVAQEVDAQLQKAYTEQEVAKSKQEAAEKIMSMSEQWLQLYGNTKWLDNGTAANLLLTSAGVLVLGAGGVMVSAPIAIPGAAFGLAITNFGSVLGYLIAEGTSQTYSSLAKDYGQIAHCLLEIYKVLQKQVEQLKAIAASMRNAGKNAKQIVMFFNAGVKEITFQAIDDATAGFRKLKEQSGAFARDGVSLKAIEEL